MCLNLLVFLLLWLVVQYPSFIDSCKINICDRCGEFGYCTESDTCLCFGRTGINCTEVCNDGNYGFNCSSTCYCAEEEECDPFRGCYSEKKPSNFNITNLVFLIIGIIISASVIFGYQYWRNYRLFSVPLDLDISSTCNIFPCDILEEKTILDPYNDDEIYKDFVFDDNHSILAFQDPLGAQTIKLDIQDNENIELPELETAEKLDEPKKSQENSRRNKFKYSQFNNDGSDSDSDIHCGGIVRVSVEVHASFDKTY